MFSLINPILVETRTFILAHSALLWPVAFATFGLGQALSIFAFGQAMASGGWTAPWVLMMLGGMILSQIGYLTVSGLLLTPGSSVGQQMAKALAKLPAMILLFIVALLVILALMIPFVIAAQLNGLSIVQQTPAGQTASMILVMPMLILMLILFAKLYLAWAGLMDDRFSGLRGIVHALSLTRGRSFFFVTMALLFIFVFQASQILGGLLGSLVVSGLSQLFGQMSGGPALVSLITGSLAAGPMVIATVFAALLYQKLSDQRNVGR
jgi:hypothetical protein